MQNTADQTIVHDYACQLSEYGGLYHDGDVLVVLFTAKLAEHDRALRGLVAEPDLVSVLPACRTWQDVLAASEEVRRQLAVRPDVSSVGVTLLDGAFVVAVGLDPHSQLAADAVRAACEPEPVVVRPVGTIVRLPMRLEPDRIAI